jgi:hypothetical protein
MSATTYRYPRTAECPECHRPVAINRATGIFRPHGPRNSPCPASRTTSHGIRRSNNQPTPEQQSALRNCHRIGDVVPVADWLGVPLPTYVLMPGTRDHLEREMIWLVAQNRQFIEAKLDSHGIEWR